MTQLTIPATYEPLSVAQCVPATRGGTQREGPRHYRIGPVPVSIQSDLAGVEEAFYEMYAAYEAKAATRGEFHIDVAAGRSWRSLRRYYHILGDGEDLFAVRRACSVLPHVEWALNLLIARHLPGYLQIHAAVVSRDGIGVMFPGAPGQGKTTLVAGLLSRGWSYFSDEFALIDPDTLLLQAYPKALCVKAGSFDALARMGVPLSLGRRHLKGQKGRVAFVNPLLIRDDAVSAACPVGMVIFPQYSPGTEPVIEPMSRAQAMFELTRVSFNFPKFRVRGVDLLAEVVRRARCYRLLSGDLETTCRLVEDCLKRSDPAEN